MAGGEIPATGPVAAWWKTFRDPELDSLVRRAVNANPDLKIAQARVREARAAYKGALANFGPTVDTGAFAGRSRIPANLADNVTAPPALLGQVNAPLENEAYLARFQAAWEVDVFGGNRRRAEASRDQAA